MMATVWLPDTALKDGRVTDWLHGICRDWSQAWLAGSPQLDFSPVQHGVQSTDIIRRRGVSLCLKDAGRDQFADALIGCSTSRKPLKPSDRTLIDGLVQAAIDDLLARLTVHEAGEGPDTDRYHETRLSCLSGRPDLSIDISLSKARVTAIRRAVCKLPSPGPAVLQSCQTAMGPGRVTLSAAPSSHALTLAEISALSSGDVLVLDQTLDQAFALQVDNRLCPDLRARYVLSESEDGSGPLPGFILESAA